MAYVNSSRAASYGIVDRAAAIVKSIRVGLERRRVFKQTVRELQALSNRELADLGIHRTMITRVANEAAYGK
ncbi:MAG: DUF1127 domain-containing protein [Pseudotabrizicola sp.]|uniref:DUF1127 domain-containing protein n=1 Tax=Pseudotabrizicola sp. TaxID=2939647 RepID=UPI0027166588|nr:DUF1127 domain-containing protein [Pseudotabrizicola sp.]MDO8883288.1 DUF1127 domain-containing protein [Pseudotabrizicola sp.]MDP2082938.1 DUF1127 domain-containing protein [Pseudotabrizicola sp.]MDZ7574470.1 DUF1127 domain-containing protein [Pseudotabrizicola sp.]